MCEIANAVIQIAVDIDGSKEMVRARIVQAVTEIIDRAANQDYKENK